MRHGSLVCVDRQLYDIVVQLTSFLRQLLFQIAPLSLGNTTSCQYFNDINHRKIIPSSACIFNRTILSYTSLPSCVSFFFKSLQYRLGILLPVSISMTSITEKYHVSVSAFQCVSRLVGCYSRLSALIVGMFCRVVSFYQDLLYFGAG